MSFFKNFNENDKINLFLGDFLLKYTGYPTRMDLTRLLIKDMKESIKGYIKDENSLFQVSQIYLDGIISSRSALLKMIQKLYEINIETGDLLESFSKTNKINSIFSTEYDTILNGLNNIEKILPTDNNIELKMHTDKIKNFKILGDIDNYNKMFVSFQDFRKFSIISLYKSFFQQIQIEINKYPTIIIGLDFNNTDLIDILELILSKNNTTNEIYAINNSKILKTKVIERLNMIGIKILPYEEDEFINTLNFYLSPKTSKKNLTKDIIEKKLFR